MQQIDLPNLANIISIKMSKSPMKDFSRLLQTNVKTVKKDEGRRQQLSYPIYQPKYDSSTILNELKVKLDAALRHNTRLLDENSTLGELANELRHQLKTVHDRLLFFQKQSEDVVRKTKNERQNLALEIEMKQRSHESELEKLLREISILHEEKNALEIEKQKEVEKLKNEFQASLVNQLQNVRSCQNNSKDLYDTQIRNLKEIIQERQHQIENIKAVDKLERIRLQDGIKTLEKEIKHLRQSHILEIQTLKHSYENQFGNQKKRLENDKDIEFSTFNLKVKRLKKDVLEKNLELEYINKKMTNQDELITMESAQFKKEKQSLLSEIKSNDLHARNILTKEKTKLQELNRLEIQNLTKLFQINIEELNGQNFKLKQLIQCKKHELKQLYDQNQTIKASYEEENGLIRSECQDLKEKIKSLQLQNKEQLETFKIKISNLLDNDLKAMSSYYQNQIKTHIDKAAESQKIIAGLRDRLYKSIQENDEIRKGFEIEVSKQRARVQDLKIKLASIQLQHKEQVSNLGSKVQLTSQTLIRESEHKSKTKGQYEQQKKKYHYLANTKDKQITELMVLMENMRRMHEDELKVLRTEKKQLKSDLLNAEDQVKKVKTYMDQQLRLKDEKMTTLTQSNQKEIQDIKELEDKIEVLQKNNIKMKKQYEHLQLLNASIAQELGLSKGFIESLQLESSAAIQDERVRMKAFIGTHQIGIREYFEDKIKSKERDITALRNLVAEKEEDVRDIIVKYNALEKRLEMMMQTNTKLRDFEQKIKNLGLDNNLIKNMAELFKK